MNLKVLLTGISGRIGKSVAEELLRHGYEVVGMDIKAPESQDSIQGLTVLSTDITDGPAVMAAAKGCEAVIHCAAYPHPGKRASQEMLRVNVIGTQNILDAAMEYGFARTVVTSSVGALGFSFPTHPCLPDYLPVDLSHPRRPQDIYGLTKLMNEESAAAATRLSGITSVVRRPPWVPDMDTRAKDGTLLGKINWDTDRRESSLWAYIDVHDLAVAYRLTLERDLTGHSVFFTMADDILSRDDAPTLIRRFFPDRVADIDKLTGNSLYDLTPTTRQLGFVAQRRWRDVVAE